MIGEENKGTLGGGDSATPFSPTIKPRSETHPIDFTRGEFLAPMVRENSLPFRLLCQFYGATATWTEALVDHRLIKCERILKEVSGVKVVDFHMKEVPDQPKLIYPLLRISEVEGPLVVQVAFSGINNVKKVLDLIKNDASAIEINAGCVKRWAVQGGMGNAILSDKDKLKELIGEIRRLSPPSMKISIKIRILKTVEETVNLVKLIKDSGADACVIHTRLAEKDRDGPAQWTHFKEVRQRIGDFPLVLNGGIFTIEDKDKAIELTGCKAIMMGRGASSNPSIFGRKLIPKWSVIRSLLELANIFKTPDHMIAAAVRGIMREPKSGKMGVGLNKTMWISMNDSPTIEKMCEVVKLKPSSKTYEDALKELHKYKYAEIDEDEYQTQKRRCCTTHNDHSICSKTYTEVHSKTDMPSYE